MDKLKHCISALFPANQQATALSMLDDLPGNTCQKSLRIQLAAVRCSGGSLERLAIAIKVCKQDFRNLLVNAGFGEDINAHLSWVPRPFTMGDSRRWNEGERIDNVHFGPNEDVWKLTTSQRRKKDAKIISLESLEPVAVYLVRYPSGKEELVAQSNLVKREITNKDSTSRSER